MKRNKRHRVISTPKECRQKEESLDFLMDATNKKMGLYDAMARRILEKEQQYPPTGVGENGKEDFRPVIEDFESVVKALAEARDHYIIIGTRDEIKEFTDGINALTGSGAAAVEMEKLVSSMKTLHEYQQIGTLEELQKAKKEENILKFYYCDSEDSYLIGRMVGNFYYAHYLDGSWIFDMSRYLPWGEHVKQESTAWKEHTFPSEPREINFSEWLEGFVKKECGGTPEECKKSVLVCRNMIECVRTVAREPEFG